MLLASSKEIVFLRNGRNPDKNWPQILASPKTDTGGNGGDAADDPWQIGHGWRNVS